MEKESEILKPPAEAPKVEKVGEKPGMSEELKKELHDFIEGVRGEGRDRMVEKWKERRGKLMEEGKGKEEIVNEPWWEEGIKEDDMLTNLIEALKKEAKMVPVEEILALLERKGEELEAEVDRLTKAGEEKVEIPEWVLQSFHKIHGMRNELKKLSGKEEIKEVGRGGEVVKQETVEGAEKGGGLKKNE